MIASLGMYDFPHMHKANDAFWAAIRANLGYGPQRLTRHKDLVTLWNSPDLLLAQTCGLPLRSGLYRKTRLIATPDYGLEGCPPGYYNSVIVVHAHADETRVEELEGQLLAYNDSLSQSGWAAIQAHMGAARTSFICAPPTGSHAASVQAILQGDADFAALDALTWELLKIHDPHATAQLRVIERTAPAPGLPFITASTKDPAPLRAALQCALEELSQSERDILHLKGIVQIPVETYCALPLPPAP